MVDVVESVVVVVTAAVVTAVAVGRIRECECAQNEVEGSVGLKFDMERDPVCESVCESCVYSCACV